MPRPAGATTGPAGVPGQPYWVGVGKFALARIAGMKLRF